MRCAMVAVSDCQEPNGYSAAGKDPSLTGPSVRGLGKITLLHYIT